MSAVFRKLLVPALLALASFALPSPVAAAATAPAAPTAPAAGTMCLNSNYPTTRIVNVASCNSGSSQRWTISGEAIYQSAHPGMCLTSDYPRTRIVNVEPCNPSGIRQHWTVLGEQISMTLV
ncbi:ricin-type beta-trefoil lectin domain protein [Streptomyces sp. MT29]|nr:ricin-type beta-trefoil lectin domain protein [Streptomyces sp. MT29]